MPVEDLFSYQFLKEKAVEIRVIELAAVPKTAADVTRLFNCPLSNVIKTILFVGDDQQTVLTSLRGDQRIDLDRVQAITNIANLRMAKSGEVIQFTGFKIGGITPILDPEHSNITYFLLDQAVLTLDKVSIGSGVAEIGLELSAQELSRIWPGEVVEIANASPQEVAAGSDCQKGTEGSASHQKKM